MVKKTGLNRVKCLVQSVKRIKQNFNLIFLLVYNNVRKSSFAGMISFPFACVLSGFCVFQMNKKKIPKAVYNRFMV